MNGDNDTENKTKMNLRRKLEKAEDNDNVTVKCPRDDCGYIWNYSGDMPMATCPACYYKCRVSENAVLTCMGEKHTA